MAAEEEDLGIDEGGAEASAPAEKGLNSFIIKIAKWVAIVIAGLVLVITVAVITVSVVGGNSAKNVSISSPVSEDYNATREVLDWYTSLGVITTKTMESNPASVRADVVLGYKKEDKATSTEITQRTVELKDYLRRYFTQKTAEELRPQNEENLKIEIKTTINDTILSSTKIKDVRFMTLDVIQN